MIDLNLLGPRPFLKRSAFTIALIGCSINANSAAKTPELILTDITLSEQNLSLDQFLIVPPKLLSPVLEEHSPGHKGIEGLIHYKLPGQSSATAIRYEEIDGLAIAEGDIILGTTDEVKTASSAKIVCEDGVCQSQQPLSARSNQSFLWPSGVIPYRIDTDFSETMVNRIEAAIEQVEGDTNLLLVERSGQRDFVTFRPGSGCSSSVGRVGGEQFINLSSNCSRGNTIHEILHAAGAWHEQSRNDRDDFVRILWDNITEGKEHNFRKTGSAGTDMGAYDLDSIMHYPSRAFGKVDSDGTRLPTIEALSGAAIGQRRGLSDNDARQINRLYRAEDCVSFDPASIDVTYHSGRWKVTEGRHWIFDFGYGSTGWQQANQSLSILQHYGADQSCFVGRPNPSLTYLLADGAAPQGPFPDEDCISFRRDRLEIRREASNKWLMTDGRSRMKVFPTADEAYRSEDIIQHYGFNRQCFVGRPGPSLSYFRR